ncbi:EamA family transporter RarD [Loktanella sp. D2R18]|uniref:EamA family transporter RarD n=1 Tax=Rhodobacterales TaxID=204455 RepID=UPI000DEB9F53|nr:MULTISPECIES: EamA family transporter RarD [Rhodobacterales]MDO6589785.1 EamA family transporter RarD [Yoonia sp. 1_MG-2023]RBW44404.1 EamA family transporter RarD [Loktanella sp. D2R18]
MTETGKGIIAIIATCVIWGLSPIYYKALSHVPPLEVLSHRALWSFVFFAAILLIQGRMKQMFELIRTKFTVISLAALMVSANWFIFILSSQIDRSTEASVGYYIYPMLAVLIGRFVLGETLSTLKWLAIGLALTAVTVLTVGLGTVPIVALSLAGTFAVYGLIKKGITAGPMLTVAAEVTLVLPLGIIWLVGVHFAGFEGFRSGAGGAFGNDLSDSLMLMFAGPITSIPLLMFSYGARRVSMATTGIAFYINPTLQFLVAVLIFAEPFGTVHMIAFPMIWGGVIIYSVTALRQERASRKRVSSAATSGTIVT